MGRGRGYALFKFFYADSPSNIVKYLDKNIEAG
jgi:hypothetical protein